MRRPCGVNAVTSISVNGKKGEDGWVVETVGLTKRFGERVAVDGVDLCVPRGVAFGYLGPNGAGKTTLIRMLLGLTAATAGTMRVLGRAVPAERADALARVGAIVEEPRFHGYLTGRQNLGIVAAARERDAYRRIDAALERTGLADRADEKVKRYSLGMRQRLGVARSLISDPELLLLDEPTNGLDPAGILEFRGMVRTLVDEGRTVVLSSHLLDEVEKICDQVAIVDHGRVVAQGAIEDIATVREKRILIATTDNDRAAQSIRGHPMVGSVAAVDGRLDVTLLPDVEAYASAGEINRLLVESGITVYRLEPARASLEDRFLEITSRLGESA
jgi:ABC-2 type transport system ATP-binding protein